MSNVPIADYALLSDCRSAALINRAGFVDWLCFPRFDGPSVFARLLDEQAGHWSICTVGATEVSRRYIEGTMALETTFHTPTGSAVLVDPCALATVPGISASSTSTGNFSARLAACVTNSVNSTRSRATSWSRLPTPLLHV